jgi:LCP family protein required for cell wall assembly
MAPARHRLPRRSRTVRGRIGLVRPGSAHLPRRSTRLVGALSLAILTAGGIAHIAVTGVNDSISRVDAFSGIENRPGPTRGTNFLLVGTDERTGLNPADKKRYHLGGTPCHCTDTIMLVHLSQDRTRASIVGIPRDSYAELPRPAKINAAYAVGGPKLTVRTVERMTGVHIDHYLEVDFTSFMKTVDVLGGVQVCTTHPLKDSYTGLDLPAGTTTLNGGEALQYVRSRHLDGASDLSRMQRQQRFLAQVVARVADGGMLANPVKLGRVASAVLGSVRADQDLGTTDLIALARGLRGFGPGSSEFTSVPILEMEYEVKGVGSTLRWDNAKAAKLWAALRQDQPLAVRRPASRHPYKEVEIPPSTIRVQVVNGTATPGLGTEAEQALRATGFDTTRAPDSATAGGVKRTVISYDPRWDRSARSLAEALAGAELRPVPGQGPVMRVALGADYRRVTPVRAGQPLPATVTGDHFVCP